MMFYYTKRYCYLFIVLYMWCFYIESTLEAVHGRYTRDLVEYELSVPRRISSSGQLISFHLPEYVEHKYTDRFKRGSIPDEEKLYYNIIFDDTDHHVELWPNHGFMAPDLAKEVYRGDLPVSKRKIERASRKLCHYVGWVRGQENSRAALSLCDGLAGYLMTDKGQYFIEPVAEHQPNSNGEHVHVIYKRDSQSPAYEGPMCSTHENWADAWMEQLKKVKKQTPGNVTSNKVAGNGTSNKVANSTSNMASRHRYIEVLVVADKKFLNFHKDIDVETYVMTIMNMVSNYYHDATVGNQLDVTVVRIMYLEKEEKYTDLTINQNAEVTLENFCKWQTTINPADLANPQHHDIAVLLTRYDLCSDNLTDCNLMGLAYVATACDPVRACAINEDSGLALGITVTHEMGHVMGCGHDNGEDSPCTAETGDGNYYVMSPYAHMATTLWSKCSKKFITELFENKLGECLNDVPEESLFQESDLPPGTVYDADFQCNLDFPGTTKCALDTVKQCEMLYCKKGSGCTSKGEPPAEGTKCAENMWCYNGLCVDIGQRPNATDGGWGVWKEWSPCSRTCGGGASYQERECNNPVPEHHGRYCIGERKQVKICNTKPCDDTSPTFRAEQCTAFNSKPFKGRQHTWKPYPQKDEMCKLHCVNEDNVFVELAPRAKDGTSCKAGTKNKCIFGTCRKVGCDFVIDSNAIEDQCGTCNGDGSMCNIVEKVFHETGNGYVKIATIPKNSRNIIVTEQKPSQNTIAVGKEDGSSYYLNGDFSEQLNGDYDFGGVRGLYDHPTQDKETLVIAGPLKVPITLYEVFYEKTSPGVKYEYADMSRASSGLRVKPVYNWDFIEFGDCSAHCGPGIKVSKAECVEMKRGRVADRMCNKKKPEEKTLECNNRPCATKWKAGIWGICSGCKFRSGTKIRSVECVREAKFAGREPIPVDDSNCLDTKPATKELCCSDAPCPKKRRETDDYNEKIEGLWYQINKDTLVTLQNDEQMRQRRSKLFSLNHQEPENHASQSYPSVLISTVGRTYKKRNGKLWKRSCGASGTKVVKDHIPPSEIMLSEVVIKKKSEDVKLTDEAFESEGDKVVDTLDFCHETVYKGKEAVDEMTDLKNNRTTSNGH